MAKKLLVPVLPSERFYDAVVAAGDVIAREGGLLVFAFTQLRPPPVYFAEDPDGFPSDHEVEEEVEPYEDVADMEAWREAQIQALDDARALLYDRGLTDANLDYVFTDLAEGPAEAIADEAAAGGYDAVVLAKGYFEDLAEELDPLANNLAEALQEQAEVRILMA